MSEVKPMLEVRDLCKFYPLYSTGFRRKVVGHVRAANQVSFDLMPHETLGLVGESGCGKTTTARAILRAINPTSGRVLFRHAQGQCDLTQENSKQLQALRPRMQMIFQDPFASLNPRMTVGSIVREPLDIHRVGSSKQREQKVDDMLLRVGLKPEHKLRYPHAFSGGQRQRIGIARALILKPDLVVADEAVSALDVSVQAQVINLLAQMKEQMGLSMIFVAHDLSVVRHICDRVAVMYLGRIVELAPTEMLFENPQHPYTKLLLGAVPSPDPDQKLKFIPGSVADAAQPPGGCAFHPRCDQCAEQCRNEETQLKEVRHGHFVACHIV